MGRPLKTGLIYFTKDVDYYDDFKIMDLMRDYGPLGQTIYDILLTIVYHEGYYLAIPIDKLASKIIRIIGNRWVKSKEIVVQVIQYCADIGLLDKDLLNQNVITSVGIQRRYAEATVRRQSNIDGYWLLDKEENKKPLLNAPKNQINVTETKVNVTETRVNDNNNTVKKSKVNNNISKDIYTESEKKEIYIKFILNDKSEYPIYCNQIDEWKSLYPAVDINQEFNKMKGWLNANPDRRKTKKGILRFINNWLSGAQDKGYVVNNNSKSNVTNKFNQFPQRLYSQDDYAGLESRLLQK
ncbi:MAG: hypothetical protein K0S47_4668 [Herbinix sp.]|jgi:hypothetical protein|nr:hypothetical protein [Herbinix sp.]